MSTSADFGRLSIYFCPLQPNPADCCLLLPSSADFCLPVPTQSLFMLYIGTGWCYMYSSLKSSDNAKRLPPLPGQTSRGRPREKSRVYSIYSSRNRSGSEFRAESQKDLGRTGKQKVDSLAKGTSFYYLAVLKQLASSLPSPCDFETAMSVMERQTQILTSAYHKITEAVPTPTNPILL